MLRSIALHLPLFSEARATREVFHSGNLPILRTDVPCRQHSYNKSYPEAEERLHAVEEQLLARQTLEDPTVCPSAPGGEYSGKIVFYNSQRGYGFIRNPAGERLFFHVSDLPAGFAAKEGVNVEFEVKSSPKGLQAINLLLMERGA
jgi:cold shock CspA family protein